MFIENELKIKLNKQQYDKIKACCDKQPLLQVNHYFDTTLDLSQMLRIRTKGDKIALQYKSRCKVDGGVFNSQEQGVLVDKEFLQNSIANGLDKEFVNKNFGCNFEHNLAYLGCGETYRLKFCYFGHEIELDKTVVDNDVTFELEYESDNENIDKLLQILRQQGIDAKPSIAKYQQFLITKGVL